LENVGCLKEFNPRRIRIVPNNFGTVEPESAVIDQNENNIHGITLGTDIKFDEIVSGDVKPKNWHGRKD
jgi:hypothetical protein